MVYFYRILGFILLLFLFIGCRTAKISLLESALLSTNPTMIKVLQAPESFEVQILYTQIHREPNGKVAIHDDEFHNYPEFYFYPASTVKLPTAVLALEYADSLDKISISTPYAFPNDSIEHCIADDVRRIFAVSDNDAYNRLYELLGRDYINKRMKTMGISSFRLAHRLATEHSSKNNREHLIFKLDNENKILGGGTDNPITPLYLEGVKKGIGFMENEKFIDEPMDFSEKNFFPISAQHEFMKRIFLSDLYSKEQQLKLNDSTRLFLQQQMQLLPRKNGYVEAEFYDSYGKFFMFGDSKDKIPDYIKIYNKVGYAYGTLTDTAYIVDTLNNLEFLLTATILVNSNKIFNDDLYEYDEIGIPFLAQLGREIYQLELNRRLK